MWALDKLDFNLPCPNCHFQNRATVRQVRTRGRIICRGCKTELQLTDTRASFKRANNSIARALEGIAGQVQIKIDL
jgi:hypothetical protein